VRALHGRADIAFRAPGRANLMGEHTDYNEGYVLPVALELAAVAAGRRHAGVLVLKSLELEGRVVIDVRSGEGPTRGWGRSPTAVVAALLDDGLKLKGFQGVIASDIPVASGLASSAALETVIARAVLDEEIDSHRLAHVCRRAENHYVGVQTGIMDQLASNAAHRGHALFLDCRNERVEHIRIPKFLSVLVIDSGVRRELTNSRYDTRRAECREATAALGVASLRDVTLEELGRAVLPDKIFKRAHHVVSENERVLQCANALRSDDLEGISETFRASHASFARDFEASTSEVDALVMIATRYPGVVGARLTGGGFGGCVVALVDRGKAAQAGRAIVRDYSQETGMAARCWISSPAGGAARLHAVGASSC
jgi:galactokinase